MQFLLQAKWGIEVLHDQSKYMYYICVIYILHTYYICIVCIVYGTSVTTANNTYPYRTYVKIMLSYGKDAKKSHLSGALYQKDDAGQFENLGLGALMLMTFRAA